LRKRNIVGSCNEKRTLDLGEDSISPEAAMTGFEWCEKRKLGMGKAKTHMITGMELRLNNVLE
jgi:hypothetical protein